MKREFHTLSGLVDKQQMRGNYFLSWDAAKKQLGLTPNALNKSLNRLVKKRRLTRLAQGLYLTIPLEYQTMGAPPPEWFIDQLMTKHGDSYYVGLLTAATFLIFFLQPVLFLK